MSPPRTKPIVDGHYTSNDEQGEFYPPQEAPLARIVNYGGDEESQFNGKLVQIVEKTKHFIRVEGAEGRLLPDGYTLCELRELEPLTDHARALLDALAWL